MGEEVYRDVFGDEIKEFDVVSVDNESKVTWTGIIVCSHEGLVVMEARYPSNKVEPLESINIPSKSYSLRKNWDRRINWVKGKAVEVKGNEGMWHGFVYS